MTETRTAALKAQPCSGLSGSRCLVGSFVDDSHWLHALCGLQGLSYAGPKGVDVMESIDAASVVAGEQEVIVDLSLIHI